MVNFIKQKLREILLNEGKQVGSLYHFTRLQYAIMILGQNHMKKHVENGVTGIPMTRNKDFWNIERPINGIDVRFEFDGNSISNKFKIRPFNAFTHSTRNPKDPQYNESEERVLIEDIRDFNVSDYLLNITINFDTIIENIKIRNTTGDNFGKEVLNALNVIKQLKAVAESKQIPIKWYGNKIFTDAAISDSIKLFLKNLMK